LPRRHSILTMFCIFVGNKRELELEAKMGDSSLAVNDTPAKALLAAISILIVCK
jgi:hypothetical protein